MLSTDSSWDAIAARARLTPAQVAEFSRGLTVPTTGALVPTVPFPSAQSGQPSVAPTRMTTPPVTQYPETAELTALVPEVEALMLRFAQERDAINRAVTEVQNCRVDAKAAADDVQFLYIANQMKALTAIRDVDVYVVTPTAITLRDLFGQAVADAIVVGRSYLAWMRDVSVDPDACTTSTTAPTTANLAEAAADAEIATTSKTAFVEAFNPVAARFEGSRSDWTPADF